ncbi:nitrate reductase [Colwellia sp. MEBiC06753]
MSEPIAKFLPNTPVKTNGVVQSTCAYCGVGCGVDISSSNGQLNGIAGTPEHPANFGRLCVKGSHLLDTIDLTNRLLIPEVGGQQVSWSQAFSEVADKFQSIINRHGKDAVAFYVSGQLLTEDYYVANKLMKGYIGSGNIDTNSRLCMSSAVSAYKRAFGEDVVPCSYQDIEQTDLIVLVGSNAAWTHPVIFQRIERAKQINPDLKVVVIDPRQSETAQMADLHLCLEPGADAGLFNGLLHYLIEHNVIDQLFIERSTEDFEKCLEAVKTWSISKTAEFCGLDTLTLSNFYHLFSQSTKTVTLYSMGINQSSSGVDKCHAIINVHLASGKIGKVGCGPFSLTGQPNAMGGREVGGLANQLTAHLDIENIEHQQIAQNFWQSPTIATLQGAKAVDLFDQIDQGQIKAVWIMATNPLVSLPERNKIKRALEQCEFVVVSDCVQDNDTLALADVKLPATPWLEKNGTVTNSERRISRQRNAVLPAGQAKHDWQIICGVAKAMGFKGFDFQHPSQIFTEFAALSGVDNLGESKSAKGSSGETKSSSIRRLFDISGLANLSQQQYDNLSPIQWPVTEANHYGGGQLFAQVNAKSQFSTESGRAKFFPITPQLPVQKTCAQFPLVLNSGRYRDQWHTMTRTGKASSLTQHLAKPYITINPKDAANLSLSNNDIVKVSSSNGEITVPVTISERVVAGQCFMPIHWNQQFAASANIANLYGSAVDPISGQPEAKFVGINIERAEFNQFVDFYIADELLAKAIDSPYWLKTKLANCWHYQAADVIETSSLLSKVKDLVSKEVEWLIQSNTQGVNTCLVAMAEQQLVAVAYICEKPFTDAKSGLTEIFAKPVLNLADVQELLRSSSESSMLSSRKVCSCHSVYEAEIIGQIQQGNASVQLLGEQLKCGTKCGSCKPELQALINQHGQFRHEPHNLETLDVNGKSQDAQTIPLTYIANA